MRLRNLIPQLLAFLAAVLLVVTGVYVYSLWRNQSPDSVLHLNSSQLIYRTADMAIGVHQPSGKVPSVTLLRFTTDGGWVIAGTGRWLFDQKIQQQAWISLIPNETGPAGGYWLCIIQRNRNIHSVRLVDFIHPAYGATYTFHAGGIVEPIVGDNDLTLKGLTNHGIAFSAVWSPSS